MIPWSSFFLTVVIIIVIDKCTGAAFEGRLQCTSNGIYPDDKLIGSIMQKCQPKLDDPRDQVIACIVKCMMKKFKALTKKGKMKKTESKKILDLLPDVYQEQGKTKFDECFKEHESSVVKESKCDSWIPFSKCFVGFASSLCEKETTTSAP